MLVYAHTFPRVIFVVDYDGMQHMQDTGTRRAGMPVLPQKADPTIWQHCNSRLLPARANRIRNHQVQVLKKFPTGRYTLTAPCQGVAWRRAAPLPYVRPAGALGAPGITAERRFRLAVSRCRTGRRPVLSVTLMALWLTRRVSTASTKTSSLTAPSRNCTRTRTSRMISTAARGHGGSVTG